MRGPSICALGLLVCLAGCEERPSAPPLEDGPVYRNARDGFRFFVPDGWKQRARGDVPAGKIASERMLVEYQCMNCAGQGALLVTVGDVPLSSPLADFITANTKTGEKWRLDKPAEEFTINGAPAARIVHVQQAGKNEIVREIIAFRRGERVYFFKGFYQTGDEPSRTAIRTAVETVVW